MDRSGKTRWKKLKKKVINKYKSKIMLMKKIILCLSAFIYSATFVAQTDSTQIEAENLAHMIDSIHSSLKYETGKIDLQSGTATLNVPQGYKFLNGTQSNYVLTTGRFY